MRILDVLCAPWAILPDRLQEICEIYSTHMRGEKIDIKEIEAQLGRNLNNEQKDFDVVDGVAVIPIEGVLAKRMNLFTAISGGTSTELLERDFKVALADPAIHSIVLHVDSPGGEIDGTLELARLIRESRGQKPVVTLGSSLIASAAFWIGSAADQVFITGETTQVGSIGVVTAHIDMSGRDERIGIKVTEITAGKFKRIASAHRPLSEEGRATIQGALDHIYSVFVQDVAAQRGVDVETVLSKMADGRIFMGSQAIEAGLVDGVSTLPALIERLNQERAATGPGAVAPKTQTRRKTMVDAATEEVVSFTAEQVEAAEQTALERGRAEGATTERERIQAVEAQGQAVPGHDALIAELKYDGKTTGPEAAVCVLAAEKANRDKQLSDMETDAPKPAPAATAPEKEGAAAGLDPKVVAKAAKDYIAEQKTKGIRVSAGEAVRHVKQNGLAA